MVVGTVGYMSPEQVRGEAVDRAVRHLQLRRRSSTRCSTGRAAFARATAAETMVAILKEDPPALARRDVSPALARIVARCLEKTRETRFQSARDLAFAPRDVVGNAIRRDAGRGDRSTSVSAGFAIARCRGSSPLRSRSRSPRRPSGISRPSPPLVTRFALAACRPVRLLDGTDGAHVVAMSPDGAQLAYVACAVPALSPAR